MLVADGVATVLDPAPGAASSAATDLSDLGQVVGHAGIVGMHSIQLRGRAFLYDPTSATMLDLGTLPGDDISGATAVNNAGQVVGFSWLTQEGAPAIRRAFVFDISHGVMSDLSPLCAQKQTSTGAWPTRLSRFPCKA